MANSFQYLVHPIHPGPFTFLSAQIKSNIALLITLKSSDIKITNSMDVEYIIFGKTDIFIRLFLPRNGSYQEPSG